MLLQIKQRIIKKVCKTLYENKYLIKITTGGKDGEYNKEFTKIRFDDFPLGRILKLHNLSVIVRSVFDKDSKYYQQTF